jgi:hypothetical protein
MDGFEHYFTILSYSICKCNPILHHSECGSYQKMVKEAFTFTLPCCIVIDLFLSNQKDALIIQIYSVIKLYMIQASSLPIIRSFLLYIRHW